MNVTTRERQDVLKLFNISEAARLLDWDVQQLHRSIRDGFAPPPNIELGKRKYYRIDDVNRLGAKLKRK